MSSPPGGGRRLPSLTLALVAGLLFAQVACAGWSPTRLRKGFGPFLAGFAGGLAVHELGHVVVATSKGYRVSTRGLSIVYPGRDLAGADQVQVASAGLQAQWLAAEAAFEWSGCGHPGEDCGDAAAGLLLAHIATSFAYATFLKDHPLGDVEGIAHGSGLSRNQVAAFITVPALLDAWRLFGDSPPRWLPVVSRIWKGVGIGYVWTY